MFNVFELREEFDDSESKHDFMLRFVGLLRRVCASGVGVVLANNAVFDLGNSDRHSLPGEEQAHSLVPALGAYWKGLVREKFMLVKVKSYFGKGGPRRLLAVVQSQALRKSEIVLEIRQEGVAGVDAEENWNTAE